MPDTSSGRRSYMEGPRAKVSFSDLVGRLANGRIAQGFKSGATLAGDVYQGRVDPTSDEGIARSGDMAGLAMMGGVPFPAEQGALAAGYRAYKGDAVARDVFNNPDAPYAGFFSNDPAVAERFAKGYAGTYDDGRPGILHEADVEMNNPLVIDAAGQHAANFQFGRPRDEFMKGFEGDYDGVILKNTKDEGEVYIPRTPEQIKILKKKELLKALKANLDAGGA